MYMAEIIGIIELLAGAAMNLWIGWLGKTFFGKDDRSSRVVLRICGIFLIINGVSRAFHI
ncbi:hypothetical protein IGX41_12170 [Bacillus velezensis]|uniref:hypothetical protein n=1 Tax=Bacillus TaxID=1386 RepID=UPI0005184019|nr:MULTISPECIES: hypothetical protein [Bacillus]AJC25225.1 membrane protein [Bacillus sp. Pc3]MBD8888493.1 hypothetical protein [Bacillus velezensis]MBI0443226.1 hypothetical protein [Bacillus velezensis]MCY7683832.1 hypothetical protein [Bacillus velezensis]NIH02779.1 hypothetical protein [Bacillus amyloliquefaciens]